MVNRTKTQSTLAADLQRLARARARANAVVLRERQKAKLQQLMDKVDTLEATNIALKSTVKALQAEAASLRTQAVASFGKLPKAEECRPPSSVKHPYSETMPAIEDEQTTLLMDAAFQPHADRFVCLPAMYGSPVSYFSRDS